MKIEFLYFDGCPHQAEAHRILESVLRGQGISTPIERIEIRDDEDAVRHRFVGSPTIRIGGVDVDTVNDYLPYAKACRVYLVGGELVGYPTEGMIRDALGKRSE